MARSLSFMPSAPGPWAPASSRKSSAFSPACLNREISLTAIWLKPLRRSAPRYQESSLFSFFRAAYISMERPMSSTFTGWGRPAASKMRSVSRAGLSTCSLNEPLRSSASTTSSSAWRVYCSGTMRIRAESPPSFKAWAICSIKWAFNSALCPVMYRMGLVPFFILLGWGGSCPWGFQRGFKGNVLPRPLTNLFFSFGDA